MADSLLRLRGECPIESMAGEIWMMERAKEELKSLEALHPARFDYLKLELQILISDFDPDPPFSSYANTQESSNRGEILGLGFWTEKRRTTNGASEIRAKRAIERAMACLRRIRILKQSFLH